MWQSVQGRPLRNIDVRTEPPPVPPLELLGDLPLCGVGDGDALNGHEGPSEGLGRRCSDGNLSGSRQRGLVPVRGNRRVAVSLNDSHRPKSVSAGWTSEACWAVNALPVKTERESCWHGSCLGQFVSMKSQKKKKKKIYGIVEPKGGRL